MKLHVFTRDKKAKSIVETPFFGLVDPKINLQQTGWFVKMALKHLSVPKKHGNPFQL
jgi:hypothetical protein